MKTNREKYPNTDDALAAWKKHREECKCNCTFAAWLNSPCEEEIKKTIEGMAKDMGGGTGGLVLAALMSLKFFADLQKEPAEETPKAESEAKPKDDGKEDGLKCPLCGGRHGTIDGFLVPAFDCPDCGAMISKLNCHDEKSFREWFLGLTK